MIKGKWVWIALAVVIAISATLPPIIWGEPRTIDDQSGGDPWRNAIYDFQTLITGFAAVLAAGATVIVMVWTDAKQETRHRELVSLSLRYDGLKIESHDCSISFSPNAGRKPPRDSSSAEVHSDKCGQDRS